jgi:putative tricarboxylic transport membrane protein
MKGDGTQLMVNGLVMVGAILTNRSAVNLSQATPIARLTGDYEVVVVPAKSPIKGMSDLARELQLNPKSVSIAGGSAGGTDHILAAMLVKALGRNPAEVNYIPYSGGGEALAAIMGNHVKAGIGGYSEMSGAIRSGRVRAIAISSGGRIAGIEIPTLKEAGIDLELANWRSVIAPPGISEQQRRTLIDAVGAMVKSPQWRQTMASNGWFDMYLPGDQFEAYLRVEDARVTEILKSTGLVK